MEKDRFSDFCLTSSLAQFLSLAMFLICVRSCFEHILCSIMFWPHFMLDFMLDYISTIPGLTLCSIMDRTSIGLCFDPSF